MFCLLLNSACLHSIKVFSLLPSPPVNRQSGGHIAKRADQFRPMLYLLPYDILLNNENFRGTRKEASLWFWYLSSQTTIMLLPCFSRSNIFWGVADTPHFPFHAAFTFLIKILLPLSMSLLTFFLFCPHSAKLSEELGGYYWGNPLHSLYDLI